MLAHLRYAFALLSFFLCLIAFAAWGTWPFRPLFPFGWCAEACAVPPAWRFVAAVREDREDLRRLEYGLCRRCGYDLRHAAGRCPECGRVIRANEMKMRQYHA